MTTLFSEQLRLETEPIWDAIYSHPFLTEIKNGTLPLEKFKYYIAQDYLYLEGFARTVATVLAKAPNAQLLEELSHRVLTPVERPLHQQLLEAVGLTVDEINSMGRSPTNTAYVNHMMATASMYGLGPTAAALLPCPWTYHLMKERVGASDHPVYSKWTAFYVGGFLENSVTAWRSFVDRSAEGAHPIELEAMRSAFITSIRYEYMFWNMAYKAEGWPI
jgi:thiaminase/transcriptional activator TenA